jgi:hypothetical protein
MMNYHYDYKFPVPFALDPKVAYIQLSEAYQIMATLKQAYNCLLADHIALKNEVESMKLVIASLAETKAKIAGRVGV